LIGAALLAALSLYFFPSVLTLMKCFTVRVFAAPSLITRNIGQYFSSKTSLVLENKDYYKRVADLSLEVSRLKGLGEENLRLRTLLGMKKTLSVKTLAADILAREPNGWIGSFVVNKGTRDGIASKAAVCGVKGLIGEVVETGTDTSFVILLTHPDFKAGCVIMESRINGVVVGSGGGMAKMLYIPIDSEVKPGSEVVTSEFSRVFPKGIRIGQVVSVEVSETGLYKCALIKPYSDLFSEEQVLIVL
jgi:rod shape-determining protein MreC